MAVVVMVLLLVVILLVDLLILATREERETIPTQPLEAVEVLVLLGLTAHHRLAVPVVQELQA